MTTIDICEFTSAYLEALLISEFDEEELNFNDLSPEAIKKTIKDCNEFKVRNYSSIYDCIKHLGYSWEEAGHDFFLSRNNLPGGYLDNTKLGTLAAKLEEAAHTFPDVFVYAGADNLIHII